MNIITDVSWTYHTPCEIQTVVIDSSFTACSMRVLVVVVVVVLLVIVKFRALVGAVVEVLTVDM